MTDSSRELLERAIEEWDSDRDLYEFHKVMEKIRAYLAEPEVKPQPFNQAEFDEMVRKGTQAWKDYAPEQDEEPVAWMNGMRNLLSWDKFYEDMTPLYLHPAPQRSFVRLSEKEVSQILSSAHTPYEAICAVENRLVEKNK